MPASMPQQHIRAAVFGHHLHRARQPMRQELVVRIQERDHIGPRHGDPVITCRIGPLVGSEAVQADSGILKPANDVGRAIR